MFGNARPFTTIFQDQTSPFSLPLFRPVGPSPAPQQASRSNKIPAFHGCMHNDFTALLFSPRSFRKKSTYILMLGTAALSYIFCMKPLEHLQTFGLALYFNKDNFRVCKDVILGLWKQIKVYSFKKYIILIIATISFLQPHSMTRHFFHFYISLKFTDCQNCCMRNGLPHWLTSAIINLTCFTGADDYFQAS